MTIVPFRNASTVLTGVRHETTGSLCIVSGGSKVGSSTGLLVASEPIRGEFGWSTDGSAVLELWRGANIHSTGAPDESVSVPAASWAGTAGDNIGACWPNLVTGFVSDWDCVRVTDDPATRIGPGLILPTGTWTYSRRVQIGA